MNRNLEIAKKLLAEEFKDFTAQEQARIFTEYLYDILPSQELTQVKEDLPKHEELDLKIEEAKEFIANKDLKDYDPTVSEINYCCKKYSNPIDLYFTVWALGFKAGTEWKEEQGANK